MSPDDHRPAVPDLAVQDLYETDFYLWTQAQAQAIRAHGKSAPIDWDRVAEEIEDMGKSDLRECYSRVATIIEHLFKLAWSRRQEPRGGWASTIVRERNELEVVMTASLRRLVELAIENLHARALKVAVKSFELEEPAAPCDASLRWTLPQILGEENDPIA